MPRNIVSSSAAVQGVDIAGNNPILCINNFIETAGNTTLSEGMVGVLDLSARGRSGGASTNASTNFLPGDSASALAQVRAPVADDRDAGIYLLLAEQPDSVTSIAVGEKGLFHLWGRNVQGYIDNNSGSALDKNDPHVAVYGQSAGNFEELNIPTSVTAGSKRLGLTGFLSSTSTTSIANGSAGLFPLGIFDGFGLLLGKELL